LDWVVSERPVIERVVLVQPAVWTVDGIANFDAIGAIAERSRLSFTDRDILLIPELAGAELDEVKYVDRVQDLASSLGAWVVGGSHHRRQRTGVVNAGVVCDPSGSVALTYEKRNPYGAETTLGIARGESVGVLEIGGRKVLVLICADLWDSRSFDEIDRPDLVLVPSFSISQWPASRSARTLWRHMAVSRAYEFATFVGISDWGAASEYEGHRSSAVAGWASPCAIPPEPFFRPLSRKRLSVHSLRFDDLDKLTADRRRRGFLVD
jgi:predicted amidohydrolase